MILYTLPASSIRFFTIFGLHSKESISDRFKNLQ